MPFSQTYEDIADLAPEVPPRAIPSEPSPPIKPPYLRFILTEIGPVEVMGEFTDLNA